MTEEVQIIFKSSPKSKFFLIIFEYTESAQANQLLFRHSLLV